MNTTPRRKRNRLDGNLYAIPGAFFITVCTKGRRNLFWCGEVEEPQSKPVLSEIGQIAEDEILTLAEGYGPFMRVEKHVIMPNHVHILLTMEAPSETSCPDIRYVMRLYKRKVSQRAGHSIWQKGFYDRIVRDEHEYREIWKYIDENPVKWNLDRYFPNDGQYLIPAGDECIAPTS